MLSKNFLKSYKINTKKKKVSYNTLSYLLLNFLANFLIVIFSRLKIKPDTITSLNFLFYIISTFLIFSFHKDFYVYGILIFLLTLLVDKCDGGLARLYNYKTFFGKFYDSIIDLIFPSVIFLGLTLNYYKINNDFFFLVIGSLASILLIADSAVLDKYAAITRWCNLENKTNIKPYLSKTIFKNIHDILKQDFILVCLILITLKPLTHEYQKYYFYTIFIISIFSGLSNLITCTISAKENLSKKKK